MNVRWKSGSLRTLSAASLDGVEAANAAAGDYNQRHWAHTDSQRDGQRTGEVVIY